MIDYKFVEIRDRGTCIPALAFQCSTAQLPLEAREMAILKRAGFGHSDCVYLVKLETQEAKYDAYAWTGGARTMTVAHDYINRIWNDLKNGQVVDVRTILGETEAPAPTDL